MNEAIKALKAGDHKTAYRLLRRHLRKNPKDVKAWLWISQATTDKKKQIDALKQALRLQPDHPKSKAIRRRIHKLENSQTRQQRSQSSTSSSVRNSEEYPFDELLAEVRAELQVHMEEKEAAQNEALLNKAKASLLQEKLEARAKSNNLNGASYTTDVEPSSASNPSATNQEQGSLEQNTVLVEEQSNEESGIDLILELKKGIEEKEKSRNRKKDAPIKSAMKVAPPVASKTTSPPARVRPRAEKTAVDMKPKSSSRRSLVLWMWGVLLLSVLVVVGVVFIIPNLPLSN